MANSDMIQEGMPVYGSNNQLIGTVEKMHGRDIHVNGQHIPSSAIARVEQNRIYLADTGAQYMSQTSTSGRDVDYRETQGEIRVPVVEERLDVEKRQANMGEVQLRKEVTEEQVSIPVELRREEVHVEQRDITDRPLSAGEADRVFEEGTIRVPVRGEEAIVTKEAVVTGEVVINKEQTVERQEITDTVRKMRVEIDENYQKVRSGFEQHFTQRGASTGRTFEQAEPNYRAGFEAAYDERYANRNFEDVEPELRRSYGSSTTTGSGTDGWQHLREEIREGWNRARGRS